MDVESTQSSAQQQNYPLLETDLVRTFVAISETGSFTRAAKQVFRTPSAVSMQVKKLEEMLGRALFVREGRHVSLTPDGEALLGYARRMLRISDEAMSRFLAPPVEGCVRFGAPDDYGTRFLPNILARFACTHPHVEVEVHLTTSTTLMERLAQGELDLTLVTSGSVDSRPEEGEIIFSEPLLWGGLRGGMAFEKDPLPLALSNRGCVWRKTALDALDKVGRRYRVAYGSDHSQGQLAALLADLAIAPLPRSLIAPPFTLLGPEQGLPDLGHYHIVLHKAPGIGCAGKALAEHISASFSEASPRL